MSVTLLSSLSLLDKLIKNKLVKAAFDISAFFKACIKSGIKLLLSTIFFGKLFCSKKANKLSRNCFVLIDRGNRGDRAFCESDGLLKVTLKFGLILLSVSLSEPEDNSSLEDTFSDIKENAISCGCNQSIILAIISLSRFFFLYSEYCCHIVSM